MRTSLHGHNVASSRNDTEVHIVSEPIAVFLCLFTAFERFARPQCPQVIEAVADGF